MSTSNSESVVQAKNTISLLFLFVRYMFFTILNMLLDLIGNYVYLQESNERTETQSRIKDGVFQFTSLSDTWSVLVMSYQNIDGKHKPNQALTMSMICYFLGKLKFVYITDPSLFLNGQTSNSISRLVRHCKMYFNWKII